MLLVITAFAALAGCMLALFPELKQQPRDAAICGGVLVLALALALLEAAGLWVVSIDGLIADAVNLVIHPAGITGR